MTILETHTGTHGKDQITEMVEENNKMSLETQAAAMFGKLEREANKATDEEIEEASERVNSDAEEFEAEFETATESEDADQPVKAVEGEDDDLLWVNSADVKAYARLTAPDEVEEIFYKGQDLLARIKDLEAKNALLMRENKEVVLDSEPVKAVENGIDWRKAHDALFEELSARIKELEAENAELKGGSGLQAPAMPDPLPRDPEEERLSKACNDAHNALDKARAECLRIEADAIEAGIARNKYWESKN